VSRFVIQRALGDKIAYGFDRIIGYYYQEYAHGGLGADEDSLAAGLGQGALSDRPRAPPYRKPAHGPI